MTERQLLSKLVKELKAAYPSSWFYKIPDSYGGKKKPFDLICIHEGRAYAFEAKVGNAKLKPHQKTALKEFDAAGGFAGVIRFDKGLVYIWDFISGRCMFQCARDKAGFFDCIIEWRGEQ